MPKKCRKNTEKGLTTRKRAFIMTVQTQKENSKQTESEENTMTYEEIRASWMQMVMEDTTLEQLKALRDYQEARAALCGLGDRKAIAEAKTRCKTLGIDIERFTSHPICIMDLDDMIAAMQ